MKITILISTAIILILSLFTFCSHKKTKSNYETVIIGEQEWMRLPLEVTHFRNGDPIPKASTPEEWAKANLNGQPVYFDETDEMYGSYPGHLYNWYAISDSRGLAPMGYSIARYDDWDKLIDYYGWNEIAGKRILNDTMLYFFPTGYRYRDEKTKKFKFTNYNRRNTSIWTSSEKDSLNAWATSLTKERNPIFCYIASKDQGRSVYCIADSNRNNFTDKKFYYTNDYIGKLKDPKYTNASLWRLRQEERYEDKKRYILKPESLSEYKYLNHNFISSFSIVNSNIDQESIRSLSVEGLMRRNFLYYNNDFVPFSKIKGYASNAEKVKGLDEFEIRSIKDTLINNLLNSYENYMREYNIFRDSLYTFENYDFCGVNYSKQYKGYRGISYDPYCSGSNLREIKKSQYNFNDSTLTYYVLEENSAAFAPERWEKAYFNHYRKRRDQNFPNKVKVKLTNKQAQSLFKNNNKVYMQTMVTIKPKRGYIYIPFEIFYLTHNFYLKPNTKDEPVLSIRLSTDVHGYK